MGPGPVETFGLVAMGCAVAYITVQTYRSRMSRDNVRSESEATLDQRAIQQVEHLLRVNAEKDQMIGRLHEEVFEAGRRFAEFARESTSITQAQIQAVQEKYDKGMERLGTRVTEAEKQHQHCLLEQADLRGQVTSLKDIVSNIKPQRNIFKLGETMHPQMVPSPEVTSTPQPDSGS